MEEIAAASRPATRRAPAGLLAVVGLAGIAAGVGATASGFIRDLGDLGPVEFGWGDTLRVAGLLAFIGGVLAMLQNELGIPVVIGASAAIVAAVGASLAGIDLRVSDLLDAYPGRGLLFIGAGVAGGLGVVLGLCGLRGRGRLAFGVPMALLSLVWLAAFGAMLRLDETRTAPQGRPFAALAFVSLVCIVTSFVGRHGALAAAVAAATLVNVCIDAVDVGIRRDAAAIVGIVGLSLVIVLGIAAVGARQPEEIVVAAPVAAFADDVYTPQPGPFGNFAPSPLANDPWQSPFSVPQPIYIVPPDQRETTSFVPLTAAPAPTLGPAGPAAVPAPSPEQLQPTVSQPVVDPTVAQPGLQQIVIQHPTLEATSAHPMVVDPGDQPTGVVPVIDVDPSSAAEAAAPTVSRVAQWGPDPFSRHQERYWDGDRWTHQVRTAGVVTVDPV